MNPNDQPQPERYCGICYKPSMDKGGWWCPDHEYQSVFIQPSEAEKLRQPRPVVGDDELREMDSIIDQLTNSVKRGLHPELAAKKAKKRLAELVQAHTDAAVKAARLDEVDLMPPMFMPYKSTRFAELNRLTKGGE